MSSVLNEERESAAMSRTPSKELIITGGDAYEKDFLETKGLITRLATKST